MTSYKTCAVPMCTSTTFRCPQKLFIHVPRCPKRRKQWLQLARRDPAATSDKSSIFFCEDHFDLPSAMENYMQYTIMGSVAKIRMKPNSLPYKFECQPGRLKKTSKIAQPRSAAIKRQRRAMLEKLISKEANKPTSQMTRKDITKSEFREPSSQTKEQFSCNVCNKRITGFRYACVQCSDWDLCSACEACGEHATHYVLRVPPHKTHRETQAVLVSLRQMLSGTAACDQPDLTKVKTEVENEDPLAEAEAPPEKHATEDNRVEGTMQIKEEYLELDSSCSEDTDIDRTYYQLPLAAKKRKIKPQADVQTVSLKKRKHIAHNTQESSELTATVQKQSLQIQSDENLGLDANSIVQASNSSGAECPTKDRLKVLNKSPSAASDKFLLEVVETSGSMCVNMTKLGDDEMLPATRPTRGKTRQRPAHR